METPAKRITASARVAGIWISIRSKVWFTIKINGDLQSLEIFDPATIDYEYHTPPFLF